MVNSSEELCLPKALQKIPGGVMLGIFQPNTFAERFTTAAPGLTDSDYQSNRATAMIADELGFSFSLTIARWRGFPGDSVGYAMRGLDTYTLVAALLEATERITMISTTHTGLWNPVMSAKFGADMDQIGRGRWGLNIVAGWNASEFRSLGAKLFDHEERYEQARHWLTALRELWIKGKSSYGCEYFTLEDAECYPRPMQEGGPVVINAGVSETGRKFAVENADFLFGNWRLGDEFAEMRDRIDSDIGYIAERKVIIGETDSRAEDRANAILCHADVLALSRGLKEFGMPAPQEEIYEQLRTDDDFRHKWLLGDALVGSPETIAREMADWLINCPVEGVCMAMFDFERDLELFGARAIEPLGNALADAGRSLVLTV